MVPKRMRDGAERLMRVAMLCLVALLFGSGQAQGSAQVSEMPPLADANGYEIVINLPAFRLYLYQNGVLVKEYPIGIGNVVSPSRLGRTEIVNKVAHPTYYPPDWYSRGLSPIPPGPSNPVGTRWLGLGWSGYGIHGTNAPLSIGTAASSGCIRMYNEDVEELADYVSIGTPVTFVYETVVAWSDPLTRRPTLRVYPDLYGLNSNTVARAKAVLEAQAIPLDGLDEKVLAAILQEAEGTPQAIPRQMPVQLNGEVLQGAAHRSGPREWVSLSEIAAGLGEALPWRTSGANLYVHERHVPGGVLIGGEPYAPPAAAAEALGLSYTEAADVVSFASVSVQHNGERLPGRGFIERGLLWLPVQVLAMHFGVELGWDAALDALVWEERPVFGARRLLGQVYLPYDRLAKLLGVEIVWSGDSPVASVSVRDELAHIETL